MFLLFLHQVTSAAIDTTHLHPQSINNEDYRECIAYTTSQPSLLISEPTGIKLRN